MPIDPIQLMLCTDEGYLHQTFVVVASTLKHLPADRQLVVNFVYCHDADQSGAAAIRAYCDRLSYAHANVTFNIIPFDVASMFHTENRLHISAATLARLIPTRWLSGKVLYLDSDLVVIDDLSPLYDTDIDGALMGVIRSFDLMYYPRLKRYRDRKPRFYRSAADIVGEHHVEDYFNAGVLLVDLDQWVALDIDTALQQRNYGQDMPLRDQDVLNQVAQGRVTFLDGRWNAVKGWNFLEKTRLKNLPYQDEWKTSLGRPAVVHFAGRKKPWQHRNFNWFRSYYKWIKLYRMYWNDLVTLMGKDSLKDIV